MSLIELSVAGYIYYNLTEVTIVEIVDGKITPAFGWLFLGLGWEFLRPFIAYLVSLSVFSIVGSIFLLRRNKHRFLISLAPLTMWTVTVSYITFGWLLAPISFVYNGTSFATGISLVILTVIMYVLLVKGWEHIYGSNKNLTKISDRNV